MSKSSKYFRYPILPFPKTMPKNILGLDDTSIKKYIYRARGDILFLKNTPLNWGNTNLNLAYEEISTNVFCVGGSCVLPGARSNGDWQGHFE